MGNFWPRSSGENLQDSRADPIFPKPTLSNYFFSYFSSMFSFRVKFAWLQVCADSSTNSGDDGSAEGRGVLARRSLNHMITT